MAGDLTTASLPASATLPSPVAPGVPSLHRSAAWLTLAATVVGIANYGYSLTLTWLLPLAAYSVFASGQALLLVTGTVASASVPWVLSHEVARDPEDPVARRVAVSFAAFLALGQGAVAATVVAVLAREFASTAVVAALAASTAAIFASAPVIGYLQGFHRFRALAGLRILEVGGRIGVGLGLVAAGAGAVGALAGFGAGALLVAAAGVLVMGRDLRPSIGSLRSRGLLGRAAGLAAIQGGVALLATLDVILGSLLRGPGSGLANYQAALILGRVPLFLSAALSMAVFPRLTPAGADAPAVVRDGVNLLARTVVPIALVVATVPDAVVGRLFPDEYAGAAAFLVPAAASGALIGFVNLVTTFFQAERRFAICLAALASGVAVHAAAVAGGYWLGGLIGLARGAVAGTAITAAGLAIVGTRVWPGALRLRPATVLCCLAPLPLIVLHGHPLAWFAYATLTLAVAGWLGFLRPAAPGGPAPVGGAADDGASPVDGNGRRLRILHLAFEDHRRPGSGGGAIRTREINRRLAARHDITVVTSRYPGCRERVEDGVHYVHAGLSIGHFGSILTYFAALPLVVRRYPADVVVEDFAAPFSGSLVPWFTRRPVVAVVQWLFAREKSRQYKLPFFVVEELSVRSHRRMIAVSGELAERLRAMNPRAVVDVIHNGVEPEAFEKIASSRQDLLFVGRIEIAQKGLDLLLDAYASIARRSAVNLVVAGDGPDAERVRRMCRDRGLEGRVRFLGRVGSDLKYDLMAGAELVCMSSRYETFGMVAAEAMACGTPVVAFSIPCLREVLGPDCGVLVEPFDVEAYADAVVDLLGDAGRRDRMGRRAREVARRFDWDDLARSQEAVYREAAGVVVRSEPAPSPQPSEALRAAFAPVRRRGRRTRVLLFGNYGNGNTGDEAILGRLADLARDTVDLTVVARRPHEVERMHGVASVGTTSAAGLWAFLRSDVIAIGGGGIFGYGMPTLPRLLPAMALAARGLGKQTVYLAIGAYPDMPRGVHRLLRLSARLSRFVSVRDEESWRTLGGPRRAHATGPLIVEDPAVDLAPLPEAAARVLAAADVPPGPPPLGISLKPTPSPELNERMLSAVAEAVDWWCGQRAGDVAFFAFSRRGDYGLGEDVSDVTLAARLASRVRCPDRIHVVGPELHPAALKGAVALTSAVVGLRLHAQIFAWATGRPLLGLSFERKSDAFLAQVGAEHVRLQEITGERIVRWLSLLPGEQRPVAVPQ